MSKLTVVATPIGNLADLSPRAKEALATAEVLACEDTRVTKKLLSLEGIDSAARTLAYHEYNEQQAAPGLIKLIQEGKRVVLVSDAGLPGLSDPGYRVLHLCREQGIPVEVIPGAHAAPMALLMSGLPTSSYTFKGFVPKKPGARKRFFEEEAGSAHALVAYESPQRLAETLARGPGGPGRPPSQRGLRIDQDARALPAWDFVQPGQAVGGAQGEAVLVIAPKPRKERQGNDD